ncbi:hypothetical protein Fot_04532 [Forsythia ovata]|uniref:DUF220 domain-containing protein n=1 Tax=Forsythia ovata TaxID=205694 RepID=A0ABD1XFV9_9LAMI
MTKEENELIIPFEQVLISDMQPTRLNDDTRKNECPNRTGFAINTFFSQFSEKVQKCLQLDLKQLKKYEDTASGIDRGNNKDLSIGELNLQKQMYPWKDNPTWEDHPPDIKVTVPKGSLCNLNLKVNVGLPPDAVYNIVTDRDNKRVFTNIKEVISRKVLVDEGSRQVIEVEQAAIWRFLWLSGTISVHVLVDQNREDYSMKFKQIKSGFMQRFEGCWKMEPIFIDEELCHPFKPQSLTDYVTCTKGKGRIASKLSLEQLIQPAVIPPPPISWYLRGIVTKTTEMLITDLLAEAARIRQDSGTSEKNSNEHETGDARNIKKRWAMRRKNARLSGTRLSLNSKSC